MELLIAETIARRNFDIEQLQPSYILSPIPIPIPSQTKKVTFIQDNLTNTAKNANANTMTTTIEKDSTNNILNKLKKIPNDFQPDITQQFAELNLKFDGLNQKIESLINLLSKNSYH